LIPLAVGVTEVELEIEVGMGILAAERELIAKCGTKIVTAIATKVSGISLGLTMGHHLL
jgi:hypothetical protein